MTSIGQVYVYPSKECRVGIVVSGKIGNAVKRNRIRRRLKEAIRKFCPIAEIVIRASGDVDNLSFKEIEENIRSIRID